MSQVHEAEPKSKSTEPSSQYGTGLAQVNTCSDDDRSVMMREIVYVHVV